MEPFNISHINTEHILFKDVLELRNEILRKPLGQSLYEEDNSGDKEDEIFVLTKDNTPIACLMLKPLDSGAYKLRQMAVDTAYQGKGLGKQLVAAAEKWLKEEKQAKIICLHARAYACEFYKKQGYVISGDTFTEVGIPHFLMEKHL